MVGLSVSKLWADFYEKILSNRTSSRGLCPRGFKRHAVECVLLSRISIPGVSGSLIEQFKISVTVWCCCCFFFVFGYPFNGRKVFEKICEKFTWKLSVTQSNDDNPIRRQTICNLYTFIK